MLVSNNITGFFLEKHLPENENMHQHQHASVALNAILAAHNIMDILVDCWHCSAHLELILGRQDGRSVSAISLHSGIAVSKADSGESLRKLATITSQRSHSDQLGNRWLERYKRCWMVQYFNTQFPSQLWIQELSETFQNDWHQCHPSSQHLLYRPSLCWWRRQSHPHSWRKVSSTFIQWCTRCTYVLCLSLCWMSGPAVRSYDTKVSPSHFLMLIQGSCADLESWLVVDLSADTSCWRYQAWTVEPTSEVRPLFVSSWVRSCTR